MASTFKILSITQADLTTSPQTFSLGEVGFYGSINFAAICSVAAGITYTHHSSLAATGAISSSSVFTTAANATPGAGSVGTVTPRTLFGTVTVSWSGGVPATFQLHVSGSSVG